ncbi:MAG: N-acetyltransferase family protein [SAR202 cluster bacterium]|nr:N-acetyltransferase family protein [SAR202 cluster bacterium]
MRSIDGRDVIRHATEGDLPAIIAIYNASIPGRLATADTEPVSLESRVGWFREHDPARHPLWVLERDGRIAGWLSLGRFHPRPAYDATVEVSVYVATALHRHGVGTALLRHAIEASASLSARTLVALVFGHNAASLGLFEKFGFERWAHLPEVADLDGQWKDLAILGRRVTR